MSEKRKKKHENWHYRAYIHLFTSVVQFQLFVTSSDRHDFWSL